MKQRRFLLHAFAFFFAFLVSASMAGAMLSMEQFVYNAYALPGQPVTFTFTFKNVGDSDVVVGFTGISMPELLTWHASVPAMRFVPGETKTVTMAATLGSQIPRTFEGHLVTEAAPTGGAPRIIPLFLVFPNGVSATSSTPTQSGQLSSPLGSNTSSKGSTSFCASGSQGSGLVIQKAKLRSSGKKTTWVAGDTIDLEVEVENTGTKSLDNVVVELGLRDGKGTNVIKELDFKSSDKQRHNIGDLNSDEEETTTFSFTATVSLDEGTYRLILKTYPHGQESGVCTESVADFDLATAQTIKIEREENKQRAIAFSHVSLSPSLLMCGEQTQLTARVSNIGDEDEDRLKISLASKDLGFRLAQEISSGLDEGDDTTITFTFTVPNTIATGSYALELSADSEYKNGIYQTHSDVPHRVSVQIACSRPRSASATSPQQPLTISLSASEEKNKAPAPSPRFVLSKPQQVLSIGILLVLVAIVIVTLTRPARARKVSRRPPTTSGSTGTPPRRPGRPPKAPPTSS